MSKSDRNACREKLEGRNACREKLEGTSNIHVPRHDYEAKIKVM